MPTTPVTGALSPVACPARRAPRPPPIAHAVDGALVSMSFSIDAAMPNPLHDLPPEGLAWTVTSLGTAREDRPGSADHPIGRDRRRESRSPATPPLRRAASSIAILPPSCAHGTPAPAGPPSSRATASGLPGGAAGHGHRARRAGSPPPRRVRRSAIVPPHRRAAGRPRAAKATPSPNLGRTSRRSLGPVASRRAGTAPVPPAPSLGAEARLRSRGHRGPAARAGPIRLEPSTQRPLRSAPIHVIAAGRTNAGAKKDRFRDMDDASPGHYRGEGFGIESRRHFRESIERSATHRCRPAPRPVRPARVPGRSRERERAPVPRACAERLWARRRGRRGRRGTSPEPWPRRGRTANDNSKLNSVNVSRLGGKAAPSGFLLDLVPAPVNRPLMASEGHLSKQLAAISSDVRSGVTSSTAVARAPP